MQEKDRIFLSSAEALTAVNIAFSQYPSQFNMISVVWPLVFGRDAYVMKDSNRRTIWAKTSRHAKLMQADENDLKHYIIARLAQLTPSSEQLAQICSQVFGTPARAGMKSPESGADGVWIDTDMADFKCLQCGNCCRTLNYRDGCSLGDYRRWQKLGRDDILAWVGKVKKNGHVVACRIWMEPGTNRYADVCPWLKPMDQSGHSQCTIYDLRPTICRQYPGTRKHGRLTGCRGV